MRRLLFVALVANLLGMLPLPILSSEAWAQRSRASKSASKSKAAKKPTGSKSIPKFESKAEPAATLADPVSGESSGAAASASPPSRGPARIDFDDRLIQGQTNKSGAVYLYDRKELKTRSMIKERDSFRSETLSTVYDQ
ncbi:hypothetical protein [Hyalangium minutum]|uniref:Uncharacterized protein n=1 Tax=Hyalangium minutum TaxID=394096 RepID=A0A085WC38_9BACT|nr:hypothetical protein [Hyalangium minutum]KFE65251.1 hypothetical protein DB31_1367 [Hyalangium minutum]